MELAQLKAFVAVAEERSVGRAATRLHLTPSPVSRAVRELERHLGTALLVRLHHDIELTDAGQQLLLGAREILQQLHRLENSVREAGAAKPPTVTVGATQYAPLSLVDRVVAVIREQAPGHLVDLVTNPSSVLIPAVRDGGLDAALVHLPVPDAELDSLPLGPYKFDVAMRAGHRLADRVELSVADLTGVEILLVSLKLQPLAMKRIQAALETHGAGPVRFIDNNDLAQLSAEILRSDKVTLSSSSPDSAVGRIFSSPHYAQVPVKRGEVPLEAGLVWRRGEDRPAWLEATISALSG